MVKIYNSRRMDLDVHELVTRMRSKNIDFEIPEQRGEVWDNYRNSMLIHSILSGIYIDSFVFNRTEKDDYEGIDGQQRGKAVLYFVGKVEGDGGYKLNAKTPPVLYDGIEYNIARHRFKDLPQELQDRIKRYPILVMCYDNLDSSDKALIFERCNQGRAVTAADISRINVKSRGVILSLVQHDAIHTVVGIRQKAKHKDEDVIKNIWCLCFNENDSLLQKDTSPVLENTDITEEQEAKLVKILDYMLPLYKEISKPKYKKDEKTKTACTRMKNMTHMPMLGYMAYLAINNGIDEEDYIDKAIGFFSVKGSKSTISDSYNQACVSGSSKPEQVRIRKDEIEKAVMAKSSKSKQLKLYDN